MARNYFYAIWLSLICIIVFVLQNTISWFTNAFVLDQTSWIQPWRFVSAIFLHASLSHIVFNLFALVLFGLILESVIGSKRFLIVFFASGIIANLLAVNFYDSSLGASGAIYGILGCLTILRPKMVVWVYSLPMPMFVATILWIGAGIMGIFFPSNVGDIAHLSGIGVGFIFGLFFMNKFREIPEKKERIVFDESSVRKWEDQMMRT
jgi:membrane associated rhomboid family serine protease